MIETMFNLQNYTEEEKEKYAVKHMHFIKNDNRQIKNCCNKCIEMLNVFLADWNETSWQMIGRLIGEDTKILKEDNDLSKLYRLVQIGREEQSAGIEPVLSRVRSVEEATWLYQKTVFYMRRMELNLPEELQAEFVVFMEEQQLSEYFLIQMLQEKVIYDKASAIFRLTDLLLRKGKNVYAKKIYHWATQYLKEEKGDKNGCK